MLSDSGQKVMATHLKRNAYLYIRQSTLRQVFENTESTKRQYGLRQKAVALGWPLERVIVIDNDLGSSGAESDRAGFQELVSEVGLGRAGIVMGLEVSRLARNSMDWHRLLEICALTETLILDEDGIYDPGHFNDRLLLGLKGTMSEAELHVLHARLQGGILNKARRGELRMRLPVGLVHNEADEVILDPDQQVQSAIRLLFATFARTGSAHATVRHFREQGIKFPRRPNEGPGKGELLWGELGHARVLQVLHNPRYAGTFVFGRTRTRHQLAGKTATRKVSRDDWQVVLPNNHPGYIPWETFESNQTRLLENAQARGEERRQSPPREGPALLQGLVICGRCGLRMTVRYGYSGHQPIPQYICQRKGIEQAIPVCQQISGEGIDAAIGDLLMEIMTPLNLEVALAVEAELQSRISEADALRQQQVERARYDAELTRRRYLRVDPDNRLVADALEADWNDKLRALKSAQEECERQQQSDRQLLDERQKREVRALAEDFPRVWNNPKTSFRERKRLIRLLIEDITLTRDREVGVQIRFKGGATRSLTLTRPKNAWQLRQTPQQVVEEIDRLLDFHTDGQIAERLNTQGVHPGKGERFTPGIVAKLRRQYGLKSRHDRLRETGLLTQEEIARDLGICVQTVRIWRTDGRLQGYVYNDKNECLYEPPGGNPPQKYQWQRVQGTSPPQFPFNRANEV